MSSGQLTVQDIDPNETYTNELYVLCILFPVLATASVVLRFVARRLKKIELWWDDWTCLLALVLIWVAFVAVVESIHHGKGVHIVFLGQHDRTMIRYWSYWFQIFYTAIPATIKLSALLLYKRIFISVGFNRLVVTMLAIVCCWGFASVLVSIFSCTPISAFWTSQGRCINQPIWVLAFGVPNILLDVMVWAMPIPRVWALGLPRSQKISLTIIFLIGLTDCVLAIIRLTGSALSIGDVDTSYAWAPAMWWCLIHTSLGIVVISLPTMRILYIRVGQRLSSLRNSKCYTVSSGSNTSDPSTHPRWIPKSKYEVGMSFSGENENSLHSNTIALALNRDFQSHNIPEKGIHVQSEFRLHSGTSTSSSDEEIGKQSTLGVS